MNLHSVSSLCTLGWTRGPRSDSREAQYSPNPEKTDRSAVEVENRAVSRPVVSSFPELEQARRGGGAVASRVSEIGTGVGKLRDLLACH